MIGCIIQARMGSFRLPKKVMKKIDNDLTVLDYVIEQIKSSKNIEKIIVATTILEEDNIISDYLYSHKYEVFRGSSEDVLDRFYQCAKKFSIDTIVRITADNPLIDPKIIDMAVDRGIYIDQSQSLNLHIAKMMKTVLPRTKQSNVAPEIIRILLSLHQS